MRSIVPFTCAFVIACSSIACAAPNQTVPIQTVAVAPPVRPAARETIELNRAAAESAGLPKGWLSVSPSAFASRGGAADIQHVYVYMPDGQVQRSMIAVATAKGDFPEIVQRWARAHGIEESDTSCVAREPVDAMQFVIADGRKAGEISRIVLRRDPDDPVTTLMFMGTWNAKDDSDFKPILERLIGLASGTLLALPQP